MRPLEPGDPERVGPYRLLARLGAGGMAIVYFGRSPGQRAVAVKVMHTDLAAEPVYRHRFRREVTASRAVGGRYCPAVLDADVDAAAPWLVTEFLPAVSLRDAVRRHGPLPADAVWPLAAGIAEALDSVHRAGIVHLDLKPANVLLTADGPRLIDLGIAAEVGAAEAGVAPADAPAGTWGFMSPEQVAGTAVGPPSDVYSLGATLVYAATGAGDVSAVADGRLAAVVAACLCPDAAGRPTVADLLAHLASVAAATGAAWPPAGVRADIDHRLGEARNPPVRLPTPGGPGSRGAEGFVRGVARRLVPGPASGPARVRASGGAGGFAPGGVERFLHRPLRRRALLLAGGLVVVGGGAAALALVADATEATVARPVAPGPAGASDAGGSGAPASAAAARTRSLEIYAYGRTTVRTLTTVVNGQAETVQGVPLPYRRTVQVPLTPVTWRIAFHCSNGQFNYVVSVDGSDIAVGGQSSTRDDMVDDASGDV